MVALPVRLHSNPQGGELKKVVSPAAKRCAARACIEGALGSKAAACRALGLARSSYYRPSAERPERQAGRKEIVAMSEANPRYGYRRVTVLLRRKGVKINAKRVQRIRRAEGLQVSKSQCKRRRIGESTAVPHSSLGDLTPSEYAQKPNKADGGYSAPKPRAARRGKRSEEHEVLPHLCGAQINPNKLAEFQF